MQLAHCGEFTAQGFSMTDSDKSKQQLMQELRVQQARLVDLVAQVEVG